MSKGSKFELDANRVGASGESSSATTQLPHVAVCICTYRRPKLLFRLLEALSAQETDGQFTFSVVVVDNDQVVRLKRKIKSFQRSSLAIADRCSAWSLVKTLP